MRLRLSDQEEAEIGQEMKERERNDSDGLGEHEDLVMAFKIVRAKRVMLPSQRTSDGSAKGTKFLLACE